MGMNVSRVRTKFEFFDKFLEREREEKRNDIYVQILCSKSEKIYISNRQFFLRFFSKKLFPFLLLFFYCSIWNEKNKNRQHLIHNLILKYSFYSSKHLSNECQNLIPSLFVITVSRKRGTSWFSSSIDEISYSAGSYFKFAGDLQESSSRWKVVRYAFRMLSDRSPRSIQKIVTLRNRRRLIRVNAKSSLLILFLPLLLLFFSLPSFSRVRFADHR